MENVKQTAKVKMSGYLHLKKKRMMSTWKTYWFVLEDRLLLFYHSEAEYKAISPCKGSVNLGPPCVVKSLPSVTNGFQIETRAVTYTLRAENSDEQKKWMQIILAAINQNQNFNTEGIKKMNHFRYSLDDLIPENEPSDGQVLQNLERQNTLPNRFKDKPKDNHEIIERLQKIGAQSYGGSLEAISKIATKKLASPTLANTTVARESKTSLSEENVVRHRRVCGDNIYERISGDSQKSNRISFLVDNENYSVPMRKSVSGGVSEKIVVPPRETKSLMVENDQYGITRHIQSEEVIYAEPKMNEVIDCNKNSVVVENSFYATADIDNRSDQDENLYEDLDKFNHYSQPVFKRDESSSQSSVDISKVTKDTKNEKPLKKSKSFIKRVWRKRNKKKDKKVTLNEEDIYAEINPTAVEKTTVTDDNALHMLSELQNILENKKSQIKAVVLEKSSISQPKNETTNKSTASSTNSGLMCPPLPQTHKVSKQSFEQVRSLSEILEDLDKEHIESKSKVQKLIEKFNEPGEDVILRKHDKSDLKDDEYRHSDELNMLLNELTKVTCAPIMTPRVTNSLVNPNLSDEEWLELLPVRRRRLSEPDYDVPRVHRSIYLPEKSPHENSDVIPATRFFGPVLLSNTKDNIEESLLISMTPDSLEVEERKIEFPYSYTSHTYNNQIDSDCFSHKWNQENDKVIYARPKSYLSVATHIVNTCQNICGAPMTEECTIVYKTVKNVDVQEEIFKDSLELCHEKATEF